MEFRWRVWLSLAGCFLFLFGWLDVKGWFLTLKNYLTFKPYGVEGLKSDKYNPVQSLAYFAFIVLSIRTLLVNNLSIVSLNFSYRLFPSKYRLL